MVSLLSAIKIDNVTNLLLSFI